ncbi:MAG: hypothetical protein V1826_01680 [bacterium]
MTAVRVTAKVLAVPALIFGILITTAPSWYGAVFDWTRTDYYSYWWGALWHGQLINDWLVAIDAPFRWMNDWASLGLAIALFAYWYITCWRYEDRSEDGIEVAPPTLGSVVALVAAAVVVITLSPLANGGPAPKGLEYLDTSVKLQSTLLPLVLLLVVNILGWLLAAILGGVIESTENAAARWWVRLHDQEIRASFDRGALAADKRLANDRQALDRHRQEVEQFLATGKTKLQDSANQLEVDARHEQNNLYAIGADGPAYIVTASNTVRRLTVVGQQVGEGVLGRPITFPVLRATDPQPVEPWLQRAAAAIVSRFVKRLGKAVASTAVRDFATFGDALAKGWRTSTQTVLSQLACEVVKCQATGLPGSKLVQTAYGYCFDGAKRQFVQEVTSKANSLIHTAIRHAEQQLEQSLVPLLMGQMTGEDAPVAMLPANTIFYAARGARCAIVVVQPPTVRQITIEDNLLARMERREHVVRDRNRQFNVALPYVVFAFGFGGRELVSLHVLAAQRPILDGEETLSLLPFTNQGGETDGYFCLRIPDTVWQLSSISQIISAIISHFWWSVFNTDLRGIWEDYRRVNPDLYDYREWEKQSDPNFILNCRMVPASEEFSTVAKLIARMTQTIAGPDGEAVKPAIRQATDRLAEDLRNFLSQYLGQLKLDATPNRSGLTETLGEVFGQVVADSRRQLEARLTVLADEALGPITNETNQRIGALVADAVRLAGEIAGTIPIEEPLQLSAVLNSPIGGEQ